jgi:hypothetical protein
LDRPIFFKTIILKGRDGTSIGSLEKTATVGVTDTYTITLTDGETYTFEVTNGTSISNISYTSSSGNVDTYTITLTDGSTQTFQVTNGEDFTVPTDGVIYYDGTDVPDGYEETSAPSGSGVYATIDDNTASVSTTYSSSKIEQLISGIGGGGVSYSTSEQDTGLKWIDGRTIYQKSYEETSGTIRLDYNFTDSNLINCILTDLTTVIVGTDKSWKLDLYNWRLLMSTGELRITAIDQTNPTYPLGNDKKAYITIQYVKLSETPNS